jgi:hypothetical protein
MTRTTNARIAGLTLLLYIVVGVLQMTVFGGATAGANTAERLANMARHASDVRINVVLGLFTSFVALALGTALYALTRDEDADIALLAFGCRTAEAVVGAMFGPFTLALLVLAAPEASAAALDGAAALVLVARRSAPVVAATFFAVGSALFCWLLLRGRMIPAALAWLGVAASLLLVVGLPLQLAGILRGQVTNVMWIPMAAFEIPLGIWWLVTGGGAGGAPRPAPRG